MTYYPPNHPSDDRTHFFCDRCGDPVALASTDSIYCSWCRQILAWEKIGDLLIELDGVLADLKFEADRYNARIMRSAA